MNNKTSPTSNLNKPKLFKGSATNPFAKRSTTGASNFGASGLGSNEPKSDGLFYPGGNTTTAPAPIRSAEPTQNNQFSSITSFGAKKANDPLRKSSERNG